MAEAVEVSKRPVVTGEVKVYKKDVDGVKTVSETLKQEKVDVEKVGNAPIASGHRNAG